MLTPTTCGTILGGILKQTRPIKTALEDFSGGLLRTKMTSTCLIMTKREDAMKLTIWDTPPNDLVGTMLKEIRVVPKEMFHLRKELGFIILGPIRGNVTGC